MHESMSWLMHGVRGKFYSISALLPEAGVRSWCWCRHRVSLLRHCKDGPYLWSVWIFRLRCAVWVYGSRRLRGWWAEGDGWLSTPNPFQSGRCPENGKGRDEGLYSAGLICSRSSFSKVHHLSKGWWKGLGYASVVEHIPGVYWV